MSASEIIVRFVVGGSFVSAFAILSDTLKPKSFAGLFGAAPSIALATLLLTANKQGAVYAVAEAHWMVAGALAFASYACLVAVILARKAWSAKTVSIACLLVWFGIALACRAAVQIK